MRIAIGLYEHFTSLDVMGPYQVLSGLPNAEVTFVAEKAGPVTDESGFLTVTARASFADLPDPDILLVGGGIITGTLVPHHPIVGWIKRAHADDDVDDLGLHRGAAARRRRRAERRRSDDALGRVRRAPDVSAPFPSAERVVRRGKIVTGAGVSAGIDMALTLAAAVAGSEYARTLQLMLEYDPAPPFDAGAPDKAGPRSCRTPSTP